MSDRGKGDDWTTEALREHVKEWLSSLQHQLDARIVELHREHDKFESYVNSGFTKQNEFRGALEDLSKQMATRNELEVHGETVRRDQNTLENSINGRMDRIERAQNRLAGSMLVIAVILPLITGILIHYLDTH
jgi:SMC interacting uncharacterized protein involved in chromosome segregation